MTQKLGLEVVAIDGKTLKGTDDRESGLKSLEMVSARSSRHRLVLGQLAVDQKFNEITAIPVLLEQLELTGGIITMDAMGTQTALAQQIHEAGADYILTLKSNHPSLAQEAGNWFENYRQQEDTAQALVTKVTCEARHHRLETRYFQW